MTGGRIARRLLPWLIGAAFLGFLFQRVPWTEFRRALAAGPYLPLSLFIFAQVAVTLLADGWATSVSLSVCGIRRPMREIVLVRGATYLLGQISYALGQGGVGLYLHRAGVEAPRATGVVLFMLAVNGAALAALALGAWPLARGGVSAGGLVAAVAAGAVLLAGGRWLWRGRGGWRDGALVRPWLVAGPAGTALAFAARLVHAATLVVGLWLAMRIWGIPVPALQGLVRVPPVLLVAALPVAPAGLGTTQTAQVLLFSEFVAASGAAARESVVLACGLVYQVVGLAAQLLLAVYCWLRLRRSPGSAAGPGLFRAST